MNTDRYRHTLTASYIGCITQAIVNNLPPLLFLTFHSEFGISLGRVTLLITMNFTIQLLVDLAATKFVDRIGYRAAAVGAHIFGFVGLAGLGILPYLLPDPYVGIVIAMAISAVGGGLIEVMISPIVEAIPGERKAAAMSLLHSFYCWGVVLVVLLSTLYFRLAGIERWAWLAVLWALIPLGNCLLFARVPLRTLEEQEGQAVPLRKLFTRKTFLLLFLLMICAGAAEQAMSQWASLFAEVGLNVSKTVGDLLGPCLFAILMGLSRVLVGRRKEGYSIEALLTGSSLLCIASYFIAVFSPYPLLSLLGCGLCGLSVGALWPGTFSLSAKYFPGGGTAMFAILALAGDVGCASGPTVVGWVSGAVQSGALTLGSLLFAGQGPEETGMKMGLLVAALFPALLVLGVLLLRKGKGAKQT